MPNPSMLLPPAQLAAPLLAWYSTVHADRDMPWRQTRDPYRIWLSEIMLQQTQVATVIPYYFRFLERFPTLAALAGAPLQDVLAHWAGLGYYRRAKLLHQAAQKVAASHAGQFPADLEHLRALPGIGRYTAGAIASIAFNLPAPVVDGNVMRVLARLTGYDQDIAQPKNHAFFWHTAEQILQGAATSPPQPPSPSTYGDVNQSLMELGATVCLPPPAKPACHQCPVRPFCRAFAENRQMELPVKSPRAATPKIRATAVVLLRKNQALLLQRPLGSLWEAMWEFPTFPGKPTAPATLQFLKTLRAQTPAPVGTVKHQLTHRTLIYDILVATVPSAKLPKTFPPCGNADKTYTAAQWLPWPLPSHNPLPIAKAVHKIAAHVASASRR